MMMKGLIAVEDIKKEPEDIVKLICWDCRLAVEMWVDSNRNTTPFVCNFCLAEGKGDINIEPSRKLITTETTDKKSTNTNACNYPIHQHSLDSNKL